MATWPASEAVTIKLWLWQGLEELFKGKIEEKYHFEWLGILLFQKGKRQLFLTEST